MRISFFVKVAAISVITSGSAFAADPTLEAPAPQRFYLAIAAGGSFLPDQDWVYLDQTHSNSYEIGPAVQGAFGVYLPANFRAEVEASYRQNEQSEEHLASSGGLFHTHGNISATSVMANLLYDHSLGRFGIYGGLGIGWTRINVNTAWDDGNFVFAHGTDDRFAYQVKAGLTYDLTESVKVVTEYAFLGTTGDTMNVFNSGAGNTVISAPYNIHSVTLGLRLSF
jgi:opacity protein-like surface antigen